MQPTFGVDWATQVPSGLEFNYVDGQTHEIVCYDPDADEEVRMSKREVIAGET